MRVSSGVRCMCLMQESGLELLHCHLHWSPWPCEQHTGRVPNQVQQRGNHQAYPGLIHRHGTGSQEANTGADVHNAWASASEQRTVVPLDEVEHGLGQGAENHGAEQHQQQRRRDERAPMRVQQRLGAQGSVESLACQCHNRRVLEPARPHLPDACHRRPTRCSAYSTC